MKPTRKFVLWPTSAAVISGVLGTALASASPDPHARYYLIAALGLGAALAIHGGIAALRSAGLEGAVSPSDDEAAAVAQLERILTAVPGTLWRVTTATACLGVASGLAPAGVAGGLCLLGLGAAAIAAAVMGSRVKVPADPETK